MRKTDNDLPVYETGLSAGMDVRAELEKPIVLNPGLSNLIPTGLYVEIPPVYQIEWVEVDELGETERGSGGFGSTGVD